MSNLSEILEELIQEANLDRKTFARNIGFSESRLTDYIRNGKLPTVENLVKMADYFQCSTDFLLGREEYQQLAFKPCPPFCKQIVKLKHEFGGIVDGFVEKAKIVRSCYFNWASGKYVPSLDNIITLAENLGCRVDYILGRES